MGVRGIPHFDQQADAEPRIACPQVAQAVGAAPASCPGCRGPGGVQKNFAESLDEIAERDAAGKPIEVWFQDEARIGQKTNITLMPLPPKSPELNPVENIWQFMRDNWLSNRVFRSYDDILEHCCYAWNKLVDQPWTVMSIGLRDWAHRF